MTQNEKLGIVVLSLVPLSMVIPFALIGAFIENVFGYDVYAFMQAISYVFWYWAFSVYENNFQE